MSAQTGMTVKQVMAFLKEHGNETTKRTLIRHGAREPFFGTRIADVKELARQIKVDHGLSIELWETDNTDAMYLAGLIADPDRISKADLNRWVDTAYWYLLAESPVAWVAAESPYGFELARAWIDNKREMVASAGWATWCSLLSTRPNKEIDLGEVDRLLKRVEQTIHTEQNRVRYTMNQFVISAGTYIPQYTERAKALGKRIGTVHVDTGETECKVPNIVSTIEKAESRDAIGKKRKHARS
jgi:3-methyladenine DNA glycosylase AlkD